MLSSGIGRLTSKIDTAMNEVTAFMFYMFNIWNQQEAHRLFGQTLGQHIFGKWCSFGSGKELLWYAELDNSCRQKLVDRANELYKK